MISFKKAKVKSNNFCEKCQKDMGSSLSRHLQRKHKLLEQKANYEDVETQKIDLPSLPKNSNVKPKLSFVKMAAYAIQALKNRRGTLAEIVLKLFDIFPYYRSGTEIERRNVKKQIGTLLGTV